MIVIRAWNGTTNRCFASSACYGCIGSGRSGRARATNHRRHATIEHQCSCGQDRFSVHPKISSCRACNMPACPRLGISGGLLFENFVATSGRRTSRRAIVALAKLCHEEKRECTDIESERMLSEERAGFFSFILTSLANRGRSANRQLFFMSLLVQARGLSRTGMEFQSKMNMCLAPRTFDLELATFMNTVELRERWVSSAVNSLKKLKFCCVCSVPC
jgi:hypothetical protein